MMQKIGRSWCAALMVLLAACASGGSESTPTTTTPPAGGGAAAATAPSLTINILNEHQASEEFTLFIEQVGGVRQSLGVVRASTSPRFTFAANIGSSYTLISQSQSGAGNRSSDRFTVPSKTTVTWDMNTRRLQVERK
jgi:hypothetical protein